MSSGTDIGVLPTFLALNVQPVLEGRRTGASVQLDGTYFEGQAAGLRAAGAGPLVERRRKIVKQSKDFYSNIRIDFDSLTEENLRDASARFRHLLQQVPEVQFLEQHYPGTCFVVPEWLRTEGEAKYGARIYFFPSGDGPAPEEILRTNIEATVAGTREPFERLQGRLHGYPECCIDSFYERPADEPPPEVRATDPLAGYVDEDLMDGEPDTSVSVAELLPDLLEAPDSFAHFAREFFPEPGCETARQRGRAIYETLAEAFPTPLVRDYFRLNYGWNYLVARAVSTGGSRRPRVGSLGREHLLFYQPLASTATEYGGGNG